MHKNIMMSHVHSERGAVISDCLVVVVVVVVVIIVIIVVVIVVVVVVDNVHV